jgi:hypothetical protein
VDVTRRNRVQPRIVRLFVLIAAERFGAAVLGRVTAPDLPLPGLLEDRVTSQALDRCLVDEETDGVGSSLEFVVGALEPVVRGDLRPARVREYLTQRIGLRHCEGFLHLLRECDAGRFRLSFP